MVKNIWVLNISAVEYFLHFNSHFIAPYVIEISVEKRKIISSMSIKFQTHMQNMPRKTSKTFFSFRFKSSQKTIICLRTIASPLSCGVYIERKNYFPLSFFLHVYSSSLRFACMREIFSSWRTWKMIILSFFYHAMLII